MGLGQKIVYSRRFLVRESWCRKMMFLGADGRKSMSSFFLSQVVTFVYNYRFRSRMVKILLWHPSSASAMDQLDFDNNNNIEWANAVRYQRAILHRSLLVYAIYKVKMTKDKLYSLLWGHNCEMFVLSQAKNGTGISSKEPFQEDASRRDKAHLLAGIQKLNSTVRAKTEETTRPSMYPQLQSRG